MKRIKFALCLLEQINQKFARFLGYAFILFMALSPRLVYATPSFRIIPAPDGGTTSIHALSGDGNVVAGQFGNGYINKPFRWTDGDGSVELPSGEFGGEIHAISGDGTVLGGTIINSLPSITYYAATWTGTEPRQTALNPCSTDYASIVNAVSGDGRLAAGEEYERVSYNECRYRIWVAPIEEGGATTLPLPPGWGEPYRQGEITDMSRDGSVIGGQSYEPFEYNNYMHYLPIGVIWRNGSPIPLGTLGDRVFCTQGVCYFGTSGVSSVSADGLVATGASFPPAEQVNEGLQVCFRWTQEGGMENIGFTPIGRNCWPTGISGDGSKIVGYSPTPGNYFTAEEDSAFVWTRDGGMRKLKDIFIEAGVSGWSGYSLLTPVGVSDDGYTIAGRASDNATGKRVSWIASLEPRALLKDPVPDLLSGFEITNNPSLLLNGGRPITGVSADGVTYAVAQFRLPTNGAQLRLSILNENGTQQSLSREYGAIAPVAYSGTTFSTTQIEISPTQAVGSDYVYHVVYRAPYDFVRQSVGYGDSARKERRISIKAEYGSRRNIKTELLHLYLVRPPVALIHGTFSSPKSWNSATSILNNENLSPVRLDYSKKLGSELSEIEPSTSSQYFLGVRRNVIGVNYNAPLLLEELIRELQPFKEGKQSATRRRVAATQFDVVAHSLGGLMARGMTRVDKFFNVDNRGKGYFRRLITLGSTHLGTHHSLHLMSGDSDCSRKLSGKTGSYALRSATIDGTVFNGAVYDQVGDGSLERASDTIRALHLPLGPVWGNTPAPKLPTAFIAAQWNEMNASTLVDSKGEDLRWICNDFISWRYSVDRWNEIFDLSPNDAIVPATSACDGQTQCILFEGVVHGEGTVGAGPTFSPHLGFNGPHLLDEESGVPARVVSLLEASETSSDFVQIP